MWMLVLFTLTGSIVLNVSLVLEQQRLSMDRNARRMEAMAEKTVTMEPEMSTSMPVSFPG